MGLFKRANYSSGLTYKQTCKTCNTVVTYKDDRLDFRPWFPNGFVYCPTCQTPLRHNENLAIDSKEPLQEDLTNPANVYCKHCNNKLAEDAAFCPKCGTQR